MEHKQLWAVLPRQGVQVRVWCGSELGQGRGVQVEGITISPQGCSQGDTWTW